MVSLKKAVAFSLGLMVAGSTMLMGCGGGSSADRSDKGKDENVLVVYNCNTDDWTAPIIKEFQDSTGIKIQLVGGGSGEVMARVRAEKDNPLGDVVWGGTSDAYVGLKEYLEPFESTEKSAIIPAFQVADDSFYNVVLDSYVLAYNTDLVKPEEAPKGWADLLDPKWKGKIAFADPGKSSTSYVALNTMVLKLGGDVKLIDKLVDNLDGKIAGGSAAQIKALSDGEYAITATFEEPVLKYMANGSHMQVVYPVEGTVLSSGGIGLIKGAKHKENAKKFINFVLSKGVQDNMGKFSRRSSRADVVPPTNIRKLEEINYTPIDIQAAVSQKDEYLKLWRAAVTK